MPGNLEELLSAAKEAVHNAIQHAQLNKIRPSLSYKRRALLLLFSMTDMEWEERSRKPGQWGLQNMRERVEKIGK